MRCWTISVGATHVRFGSLADIRRQLGDVRFTPNSGHPPLAFRCPLCANSGHRVGYSITSSVATSRPVVMVRPSAFAVFRLMTVSYLVGASAGLHAPSCLPL